MTTTSTPYEWFERAGGREGLAERFTWRGVGRRCLAGMVGGLVAGTCMMVWNVLHAGAAGRDYGFIPKLIASTFLGVTSLIDGAGAVVFGLGIHAFISIFWGIFFAFVIPRRTPIPRALGWGLAHGFFVWATMTWTVLPWADPTFYARIDLFADAWLVANLIYGVASFVTVPVLQLFPRTTRA
jgi:hypothetical protein